MFTATIVEAFFSDLKPNDLYQGLMTSFNNTDENPELGLVSFYLVVVHPIYMANEPVAYVVLGRSLENVSGTMELAIAADVQIFDPDTYDMVTTEYLEGEELEFYQQLNPFL